jgi:hypothetical protein
MEPDRGSGTIETAGRRKHTGGRLPAALWTTSTITGYGGPSPRRPAWPHGPRQGYDCLVLERRFEDADAAYQRLLNPSFMFKFNRAACLFLLGRIEGLRGEFRSHVCFTSDRQLWLDCFKGLPLSLSNSLEPAIARAVLPEDGVLAERLQTSCRRTRYRSSSGQPIRPQHRKLYAFDWKELSIAIRFGRAKGRCERCRAKGRCERCRRPHGQEVLHLGDGRWWDPTAGSWRNARGRQLRGMPHVDQWPSRLSVTRVALACAHVDHDPTNNRARNLVAVCQSCHLALDRDDNRRRRQMTLRRRKAGGDLFLGPYSP